MSGDGVRQAAQVLRTYLNALASPGWAQELSAIANLVYADRLNQPPIDPGDPDAIGLVCQRYSDIIAEHLNLEMIILAAVAHGAKRAPDELLDEIVRNHLGGYPQPS